MFAERYVMPKKTDYFQIKDFHEAVEKKDAPEILSMLRGGALYHIEETDSVSVLKKLLATRDMRVMNEVSRHIHFFPGEILSDMDLINYRNRDFLNLFLAKHVHKFLYKEEETAALLFVSACASDCVDAIRFLLKKGVAECQYPRIISSSEKVRRLLPEVKTSALSNDTISTFFMEAALTEYPEDRIYDLLKNGFNIRVINSDGQNVVTAFRRGIDNYAYPKNKQGTLERQRDENGFKTLEKIYISAAD